MLFVKVARDKGRRVAAENKASPTIGEDDLRLGTGPSCSCSVLAAASSRCRRELFFSVMARIRDRTEDFKDAVHSVARSTGYSESKLAALMASFIMHKSLQRSPFMQAALKTLESIEALNHFIVKHRKDYVDLHRTTEQERDSIEHEVSVFIKTCKDQIDILKNKIIVDENNGNPKSWLGIKDNKSHADVVAHKHGVYNLFFCLLPHANAGTSGEKGTTASSVGGVNGPGPKKLGPVCFIKAQQLSPGLEQGPFPFCRPDPLYFLKVLILSERLHTVTAQFDRLRSIRFQDAVNRAMPRRKFQKVAKSRTADASESNQTKVLELREQDPISAPVHVQEQLLDDETRALQVELSNLLDAVQETETKMVEMSALNHLMSTHVLQQAQQIEHLYEQAVEATKNVESGNKELSQAIQRNSSSRTFLLLFLFILTFSVLFLDWRRRTGQL
ncbi:hypothetical protein Taro_029555 [Colocasia esculenta]|uniref:SNARE-complex protein Syntaxin-18 N-terminal domain-containing protein n=1 Tax=Colocasia esculenta TaxID=4460 RepID=A0A843VRI8_COLES|nr:hypothetical protein [Colocasia esculenta]